MRIKNGVRFASPEMAMCHASMVVHFVIGRLRDGMYGEVTGGVEGHSLPSLHVLGGALDYRTRALTEAEQRKFANEVRDKLGDGFDVVLEHDPPHLHVEYDPK